MRSRWALSMSARRRRVNLRGRLRRPVDQLNVVKLWGGDNLSIIGELTDQPRNKPLFLAVLVLCMLIIPAFYHTNDLPHDICKIVHTFAIVHVYLYRYAMKGIS